MRLVYAVIRGHAPLDIQIVDTKPEGTEVDVKQGTWDNMYKLQRHTDQPIQIGEFRWWDRFEVGTTIGVYDIDNLVHLELLTHLVSKICLKYGASVSYVSPIHKIPA